MQKRVAFLRGINVGGHHKVPMAELRTTLGNMGLSNVTTLLNSGNILYESRVDLPDTELSIRLEKTFGFPIPTVTRKFEEILSIHMKDPFAGLEVTKDTQRYVSFLKEKAPVSIEFPWKSEDGSYSLLGEKNNTVFSVLDLSIGSTPKAMDSLEKIYGKDITTRNWNTVIRIIEKARTLNWL